MEQSANCEVVDGAIFKGRAIKPLYEIVDDGHGSRVAAPHQRVVTPFAMD